jgi:hypothetical protein
LSDRGLLLREFADKFTQLEELLVDLKEIAEIELENNPIDSTTPARTLTTEQYGIINNIGGTLEEIATFPPEIASQIEGDEDDEMAIIADVHTDPNTAQVLEEGVGYPMNLFVIVPVNGEFRVSQGPMFAYYEFTWPMSDRLTDGAWQDMLKSDPPELPIWMESFVDMAESQKPGERFGFQQMAPWRPVEMNVTVAPEIIEIGVKIEVQAKFDGVLDSSPRATLRQADRSVEVEMKLTSEPFFSSEYTTLFETNEFEPGAAMLTVTGYIGEEEIAQTKELTLDRSSAVEGLDYSDTDQRRSHLPENRAYSVYPNPFNPDVWIPYELKQGTQVKVEIYNVLGHLIRTMDLGYKLPGRYIDASRAAHWDGRNSNGEQVASGLYFYKLKAGDFVASGRMIAVK